jgi:membrane-bound metal-dependent hydrolase YbcI (DUF457 family)
VLLLDALLSRLPPRPISGVVDEAAHLATGAVVLAAWPAPEHDFEGGLAAGSVLIDADHVPELWGRGWLRPPGARPVPHSLVTPGLALWRAERTRSGFARGVAVGLAGHLLRDLATGTTGVALLWPLTRRPFRIRYRTYTALLALLAGVAAGTPPPRRVAPSPPAPTPVPAPQP